MYKLHKKHINITLDEDLLGWVDTFRGQSPRSSFINEVLSRWAEKSEKRFDWGKEEARAEEDIRKGRIHKFRDVKKAVRWLKS